MAYGVKHYYVDPGGGNDYNGASFTDGAFTVADMTLTKTGAFTKAKANHWYYLTDNGSGNVTTGYYKVASVTSANAVVLAASPKSGATDPTDVKCTQATGTSALPFKSVQGCLDCIARNSADNGGDQINVKAGTTDTLSAVLSFTTWGTPGNTTPLWIRGYTSTANDGGIGVISGAATYQIIAIGADSLNLVDMRFTDVGANTVVDLGSRCIVYNCEFDTGSRHGLMIDNTGSLAIGCYFHGLATETGYDYVRVNDTGMVAFCTFDGAGMHTGSNCINTSSGTGYAIGNLLYGVLGIGIKTVSGFIIGNTIVGNAGTIAGIKNTTANVVYHVINNLVAGFSGAGGKGISAATTAKMFFYGGNVFYNNTSDTDATDTYTRLNAGNNDSLGADPFTNAAGGDYSINGTVAGLTEDALVATFKGISTTNKADKGAVQAGAGAGGGGGGAVSISPIRGNVG